jgi:hypothetical protein
MKSASPMVASDKSAAHGPAYQARVQGRVAPGFEQVRAEFERNFAERGEIGAAVAAYWRGEKVATCGAAIARPNATRRGMKTR